MPDICMKRNSCLHKTNNTYSEFRSIAYRIGLRAGLSVSGIVKSCSVSFLLKAVSP